MTLSDTVHPLSRTEQLKDAVQTDRIGVDQIFNVDVDVCR